MKESVSCETLVSIRSNRTMTHTLKTRNALNVTIIKSHLVGTLFDQIVGAVPNTVLHISELDLVTLDASAAVRPRPVPHQGGRGTVPIRHARHAWRVRYCEGELKENMCTNTYTYYVRVTACNEYILKIFQTYKL